MGQFFEKSAFLLYVIVNNEALHENMIMKHIIGLILGVKVRAPP